MARSAPRRRAETQPRGPRLRLSRRPATVVWLLIGSAGVVLLALGILGAGRIVSGLGALIVAAVYTWGASARSGGRPVVFTGLAVVLGIVVLVVDDDRLNTGAAVMTGALAAILAVMSTVPARTALGAVRETLTATVMAAIGAVAVIGWEPAVSVSRFQYTVLVLALAGVFGLVYRLGAGLHGLGRRGVVVVGIGVVMLAATLLYAEMLRRYGSHGVVAHLADGVDWMRHHLGGYPRPVEALLGIPALVWGTQMRSRRRQGWWVCAFGTALTAPIASTLVNPDIGVLTALVSAAYSLVVGLLIGVALIKIDVALTGAPKGTRAGGRRAVRVAVESRVVDADRTAVGAEPLRTQTLL